VTSTTTGVLMIPVFTSVVSAVFQYVETCRPRLLRLLISPHQRQPPQSSYVYTCLVRDIGLLTLSLCIHALTRIRCALSVSESLSHDISVSLNELNVNDERQLTMRPEALAAAASCVLGIACPDRLQCCTALALVERPLR